LPRPIRREGRAATVVVIDDDKRVIELLEVALSGSGYRTYSATDGEQGVSLVEKIRPDLVVLDVRLPKKNGYQVCEALKANPLTRDIPVVMISGLVEPAARVQGLRCGAEDFLTKPFSPKELLLRMRRILARAAEARSRAAMRAQAERELLERERRMSKAQRSLAERVERSAAVAEMGRAIACAGSLDELADQLIVSVQVCLRIGAVLILVRRSGEERFRLLKSRGVSPRAARNVSVSPRGELWARLASEGRAVTLEELDGVPGLRGETGPLLAAGLAAGMAVDGFEESQALILVGTGRWREKFEAEHREDFESLCRFFGAGLTSVERAEAEKAAIVDAVETLVVERGSNGGGRQQHCLRVARFVETIWESLELPPKDLTAIRLAALVHEGVGGGNLPPLVRDPLMYLTERYDGAGGPLGLREREIPLEARILAVADAFDECLAGADSPEPVSEAIRALRGLSGTSLDPDLVEALVNRIVSGKVRVG